MKKNNYMFNDKVNKIWFIFLPIIWIFIFLCNRCLNHFSNISDMIDSVRFYSIWEYIILVVAVILLSLVSSFIKNEIRLVFQILFAYLILFANSIYTICKYHNIFDLFGLNHFICILTIVFEIIACVLGIVYVATKDKMICFIMLPLNLFIAYGFNSFYHYRFITMVSMIFFFVALLRSYEKSQTDNFNQTKKLNINVSDEYELSEVIRQYKELLDSGVITEEEYNEKKNELLH